MSKNTKTPKTNQCKEIFKKLIRCKICDTLNNVGKYKSNIGGHELLCDNCLATSAKMTYFSTYQDIYAATTLLDLAETPDPEDSAEVTTTSTSDPLPGTSNSGGSDQGSPQKNENMNKTMKGETIEESVPTQKKITPESKISRQSNAAGNASHGGSSDILDADKNISHGTDTNSNKKSKPNPPECQNLSEMQLANNSDTKMSYLDCMAQYATQQLELILQNRNTFGAIPVPEANSKIGNVRPVPLKSADSVIPINNTSKVNQNSNWEVKKNSPYEVNQSKIKGGRIQPYMVRQPSPYVVKQNSYIMKQNSPQEVKQESKVNETALDLTMYPKVRENFNSYGYTNHSVEYLAGFISKPQKTASTAYNPRVAQNYRLDSMPSTSTSSLPEKQQIIRKADRPGTSIQDVSAAPSRMAISRAGALKRKYN